MLSPYKRFSLGVVEALFALSKVELLRFLIEFAGGGELTLHASYEICKAQPLPVLSASLKLDYAVFAG